MGIGMLHFPHTDILVPDQGRNGCRINRDPDSVQAQLIGIHHMSDAPPDHRCMPRSLEPFVDLSLTGLSGRDQQVVGQQFRRLHWVIFLRVQGMPLGYHRHPGFLINRQHLIFFCIIRCRDHGDLAQSLRHTIIHIIRIPIPQIILHMGMFLPESRDPFREKSGTAALYRRNI